MDAAKVINTALAEVCRDYSLAELLAEPALHAQAQPKPLYTVSTTSGTGSEVTPFATVWHHEVKKKLSGRACSLAGSGIRGRGPDRYSTADGDNLYGARCHQPGG